MGQKDIATKNLLRCKDVFADVMNATLFKGKSLIAPEELIEVNTVSSAIYPVDGKAHEQLRDVAFRSVKNGITMRLLGCENQTSIIDYMPLRVISYDGIAYGEEASKLSKGEKFEPYPVITVVLNYTNRVWSKPKSIHEMFNIKPGTPLASIISDYRIIVVDVGFLSEEQLQLFKSDFMILAGMLSGHDSVVNDIGTLKHAPELSAAISAFMSSSKVKGVIARMKGKTILEVLEGTPQMALVKYQLDVQESCVQKLMKALNMSHEQAEAILFAEDGDESDERVRQSAEQLMREMNL